MSRRPVAGSRSVLAWLVFAACGVTGSDRGAPSEHFGSGVSELEVQALVMQMADDYDAALAETVYLVLRQASDDPRTRWLGQSFLRNGMGASLSIAAGPNPDIALLDLLVLGSLQAWAFEQHWIPSGIDAQLGATAVARLRAAEAAMWESASGVLSVDQAATLRGLIDAWIEQHPDRMVVAFVRMADFTDDREISTAAARGKAVTLLQEVGEATAAVEEARLFGERALWFANRYPYVLGQQVELTAYRIADQPEARQAVESMAAVGRLADAIAARFERLEAEEQALFDKLRVERAATVEHLRSMVDESLGRAIAELAERVETARKAAIDHFFERVSEQRDAMLEQVDGARQAIGATLAEARTTAEAGAAAGREVGAAAAALDRVLARFDRDPAAERAPLRLEDLRDAAVAVDGAAGRALALAERLDAMTAAPELQRRLAAADDGVAAVADAFFWRGAGLVGLLVLGLCVVRLVPARRSHGGHAA